MRAQLPWKIADLIVGHFCGSNDENQEKQLHQWLEASPEHQALYEKIKEEKNFDLFQQQAAEHDYSNSFGSFCRYVRASRRKRWIKRCGYVAAALVPLAFFIGLYTWKFAGNETQSVESIVAGQYQALLTLPNGKTFSLDKKGRELEFQHIQAHVIEDTLTYEPLNNESYPEYHRITIPRGGEYALKLADGSRVWLNSESELKYPTSFIGSERRVFLKGEAYFEVKSDSLHPFIVETDEQQLTVLGTSFAIRAFEGEEYVLTTLESGKVNIVSNQQQVILLPGEQSKLAGGKLTVAKVNTLLYTAWRKGKFIFVNQPLEEIMQTLARWYNIEVFYSSPTFGKIRFTGELQRYSDIRELLEKFELLEKVKFDINDRTVTVLRY